MALVLYVLALGVLAVHAPAVLWQPGAREFFIILGVVGAWRYSWGGVHLVRSLIYRGRRFPELRARAFSLAYGVPTLPAGADAPPEPETPRAPAPSRASEVFIVVTSYRIQAETTTHVYRAAIAEAIRYGAPATVVASIVELGDQRLIKAIFERLRPPPQVRLMLVRLPGHGKRTGLAVALRAIARCGPRPGAAVVVLDGDTMLVPGTLTRTLPFFAAYPSVDGITTDQDAVVRGGAVVGAWHRLRFAQRHLMMSSMSLSGRLLTMTGRMSLYRAEVATDPGFIRAVEDDALDHWRLGRFRLLTGEDKSTWLWLLERGRRMLYVPDVRTVTIEHPPAPRFLRASTMLMLRWFGNMLRASRRAIALGPRRVGGFTWWCLVDQRLSMWTPLIGPLVAIYFTLGHSIVFLYTYLLWIGTTRLIQTLLLLTQRDRISGLYPFLIYYNQVYGALVKIYVLFHLDRQRWTRQNIRLERALRPWQARLQRVGSAYVGGLALAALATAVAVSTGMLRLPEMLAGAF